MTDIRNGKEFFGFERLLSMVDALADRPAREIVDTMFEVVERFAVGHPQDDDQTLVVIKGVA
jgi:sigma-B regulation protein RsbU (phosphoserine phosphatase)